MTEHYILVGQTPVPVDPCDPYTPEGLEGLFQWARWLEIEDNRKVVSGRGETEPFPAR